MSGEAGDQRRGQGLLTGADRAERGVGDPVGAALAHRDQPDLGEGAGRGGVAGAAELLVVGRGGGHVQYQPVDGHHPQPAQPRPAGAGPGHRHRDPLEQQLDRASPRRVRAWEIALVDGTVQLSLQFPRNRSPFTSWRITSS